MRSEKISTQACLRGFYGTANWTDPRQRKREHERIKEYWPPDLLRDVETGSMAAPAWRMLLDPVSWKDPPPEEIHAYVRSYLAEHGRWPSLDALRRLAGRVSNHRSGGEVPGQEALL